jgi:hypothetical protein
MGFYLKRVVERDTPELQAERLWLRAVHEQAARERDARWSILTPENVVEAAKWHQDRLGELLRRRA